MLAKGSQNWQKPVAKNSQVKRLSFWIPCTEKIIWLQVRKEEGKGGSISWAASHHGQCRISPTLGLPKNASTGPFKVIYKKKLCKATSWGRLDFKTKYSNFRHNFGITRPVARFWDLASKIHFYRGRILVFIICLKQIFC